MPLGSWERYILVVEDDAPLRDLYRTALRAAGYAVVGVEDGLDALRLVDNQQPAAIVLDLGLPRLNGRDVQRELKTDPVTAGIPVIVVTGSDTSNLDPVEFPCILRKPTSPEALIVAVETCLRRMPA
jgi:DNA-binding response OmpR family regulator